VVVAVLAACWCYRNGCILYYGDAESHLNISRGLIDSATPGYDQLGTVWLPVLHVICLPLVGNRTLWVTGLAGTIPVAICFVVAGICFFLAARDVYSTVGAALVVTACFALNPNVLYLAVIPMTEVVFLAGISIVMLAAVRFQKTQRRMWMATAVVASWLLSLTRYDGWFLIPFIGVWLALGARNRKMVTLIVFIALASLAPLYWFAHNWYLTGNALDFYNGPYSPRAIQHGAPYPGLHDWLAAFHYYSTACLLCAGGALIALGALGACCALWRRSWQPVLFLFLTPLFYIWSMHSSSGTPIHVPSLWPFSYYNTRYGIAAVPLCAMAAGALAAQFHSAAKWLAPMLVLIAVSPWLLHPNREKWICWKESQVNSIDRRAWTSLAAGYIRQHPTEGDCISASSGDVTGVFREAGIPLRTTLNIGNGPRWFAAITRPDLFHPCSWAIMQRGDTLDRALTRGPYIDKLTISTSEFSPDLVIAKRTLP